MSALEMDDIPADFPVRPIDPSTMRYVPRLEREIHVAATCGECGLSWDDEEHCPPSGRCPFEYFHEMDEPDEDEIREIHAQGLHITITHSEGSDGALLVMIDTTSEPDGSDGGRGIRVLLNDEPIYNVVPYRPRVAR